MIYLTESSHRPLWCNCFTLTSWNATKLSHRTLQLHWCVTNQIWIFARAPDGCGPCTGWSPYHAQNLHGRNKPTVSIMSFWMLLQDLLKILWCSHLYNTSRVLPRMPRSFPMELFIETYSISYFRGHQSVLAFPAIIKTPWLTWHVY